MTSKAYIPQPDHKKEGSVPAKNGLSTVCADAPYQNGSIAVVLADKPLLGRISSAGFIPKKMVVLLIETPPLHL